MCCLSAHFPTLAATRARPWECSTCTVHTAGGGVYRILPYSCTTIAMRAGECIYIYIRVKYGANTLAAAAQGGQLEHELEHCAGAAFYHRGVSL